MSIIIPPPWVDKGSVMRWCEVCEIHRATALRPVCPVCTDKAARDQK